jgi:hypothetical protein
MGAPVPSFPSYVKEEYCIHTHRATDKSDKTTINSDGEAQYHDDSDLWRSRFVIKHGEELRELRHGHVLARLF